MSGSAVVQRIITQVEALPVELQRRGPDFAQALTVSQPKGSPGRELLRFAGTITLEDTEAMTDAIEAGCERVDPSEW